MITARTGWSQAPTSTSQHADESLHVAIAGPVLTEPLAHFLGGDAGRLPAGVGGASSVLWLLISDLVSRGQRVSVVTLDNAVSVPVTASGPLLDVVYGPRRARHTMRDLMGVERRAVRDGVLRTRPELVHAHWCCEYALGALATGIPTLITVHDWMPAVLKLTNARFWPHGSGQALLYFTTLARARHLTAVSPYIAEKVRHFSRAAIEVVPNGVPDAAFAQEGECAGRLAIDGRPVIISVNQGFGPRKNVQQLLKAHRALRQRGIECELHLVGDGYEPGGACERWARQSGVVEQVSFLGVLPHAEVLRRMRQATVYVHPSRWEACCMTILEAMSQHTPVIGGMNSGGVPWELGYGNAGLLVDVDNPRSIAEAIEAMLEQPSLRERRADDGYAHAWKNFRQLHVTDLYLEAYRRLLSETQPRHPGGSRDNSDGTSR